MYNFRKSLIIIVTGIILLGLTGCNNKAQNTEEALQETVSVTAQTDNKINLSKLKFTLPANWVKRGNENEIFFDDENKQTIGGISLIGYYGEYKTSLPNHSNILSEEDIVTPLGKGKLFTLELSEPAAAKSNNVWKEMHAIIPIKENNLAYDIRVNGNKDTIVNILKSLN